jgi:hypothetical protein
LSAGRIFRFCSSADEPPQAACRLAEALTG